MTYLAYEQCLIEPISLLEAEIERAGFNIRIRLLGCNTTFESLESALRSHYKRKHIDAPSLINNVVIESYYANKTLLGRTINNAMPKKNVYFFAQVLEGRVDFYFNNGDMTATLLMDFFKKHVCLKEDKA